MKKKARVIRRDNKRCLRCGSKIDLTVDHIVPKKKGGHSGESNLQCLCYECNQDKAATIADYKKIKQILLEELLIILRYKVCKI